MGADEKDEDEAAESDCNPVEETVDAIEALKSSAEASDCDVVLAPREINQEDNKQRSDDTEFCRSELAVGELELVFENRADVGVSGDCKIGNQHKQSHIHPHDRGESCADTHHDDGEYVDVVVDEEAVDRPLRMPHAGHRAVETVTIPVQKQSEHREPHPVEIDVGKSKTNRAEYCTQSSYGSQHIRRCPNRLAFCKPYQSLFLHSVEQRSLDSCRFFVSHNVCLLFF